ncbi:FG-GAP-like repeat-containing protein [Streptomyces scabiei]|uniref:FG-GAP-like repeat-containing protein n=1 Tax=Streptomyces scabiei TaxID=1930 RepID=UPI00298FCCA7|nr:FG-GAP-like repeat-containing protein [Streptomyces scabiei]MDW8805671.1 FG-GAP-like repeat-containing protein [Streptomyces scabiei]
MPIAVVMAAAMVAPLVMALPSAADDTPSRPLTEQGYSAEESKALTQAAESGQPVELLSHRGEASQVFANPEGTFTEERYATAQWARQGNRLVDFDTSLSTDGNGKITPKATAVGLEFSGGGEGPLATITRDGRSISLSWPTALPEPEIANDTVTYPEVLPDVDLKLRAGASGFAQLLVVKSAQAAANPDLKTVAYEMSSDGVNVSVDEHGNLSAVNPGGQELFTAPTPRMWDSSTESSTEAVSLRTTAAEDSADPSPDGDEFEPGRGAQQAAIPVEVTDDTLRLTPDTELMTGEDTTYPVYIDPYIDGSRYSWTIAYKKFPNSSFYNGAGWGGSGSSTSTARAGYENETNGLARSYFRMNTKNLWSTNKQVLKSTFRIKNTWSWSCTAKPVQLWRTAAIGSSTTWNNRPDRREQMDSVNDAKGWSSSCPAGNLAFDITRGAKDAAAGKWNTITLELAASNESDVYGWKKFAAKSAVMSTEYNTVPNAPTALDTSPVSTRNAKGCGDVAPYGLIGNTDFYLTAKVSDRDGGTVKAQFHLWATGHHDDGPGVFFDKTVSVTSGTVAKVKVSKAELTPHLKVAGGNFSWKVQAEDGKASSGWTPVQGAAGCRFVFDPTRPSTPPGITSSQFPDGSDGWPATTGSVRTQGAFTLSSGGVADVTRYEYWTDTDPTVRTATPAGAGGSVSVSVTPTAAGSNHLYARSVDRAGNKSDQADYLFYANGPKEGDKPGDINGDGNPDMWGVDKDGTLRRFFGPGDGTATEASSTASNASWTGVKISHRGDWTGDGYEDLIALRHDATTGTDRLWIHPNSGYGFACTDCSGDLHDSQELTLYDPANNHWQQASEILTIGDVDGPLDVDDDGTPDIPGHPDLLVRNGDLLWLYFGAPDSRLDSDREPLLIGTEGWAKSTLIAPGNVRGDDRVDLISRNTETGDLYIHTGTGDNGDGLADQSTKIKTGYGFTAGRAPLVTSPGDADHDGVPDLWTVLETGHLWFVPRISKGDLPLRDLGAGWSGYQALS